MEKIRRGGKTAESLLGRCIPATKPAYLQKVDSKWDESCGVLEALCAQTNLFRREMKIKKMYLKSNTRQENFRTFEERDVLNKINSD